MHYAMIAILSCALGQDGDDPQRYEPEVIRSQGAPAAAMDEETPDGDPASEASSADESPHEALQEAPDEDFAPEPDPPSRAPGRYREVEPNRYREVEPEQYREAEIEPAGAMQPLENSPRQKLRPPELIAEALESPKVGALVGTPMTLSQAIARASDRATQLKITQAYWRLATAQAGYHWSLEQRDLLRDQTQSQTNTPGVLSARAAARADLRDAQLAVEHAQLDLAELLGRGEDKQLPLASDRPHVGEYRTQFESIYGNRLPPARVRLIHRTLPVRRKAIDAHAEAIVAAFDAVQSAGDEFRESGRGLSTLLAALNQLKLERQAFINTVRVYNYDIAEYAVNVAPASVQGPALVSMMIRTTPPANNSRARTLEDEDQAPRRTLRKEPASPRSAERRERKANYLADDEDDVDQDAGLYEGLRTITNSPLRVQKLGNLLHWDRVLPADSGQPLTLTACLAQVPAENRLAAVEAYWRCRESAARYQALADRFEQLNALQSLALPLRDEPGMAEAGVRLQASRRAARAAVVDAQADLVIAQFNLMQAAGRRMEESWALPTSVPQSGRYAVSMRARRSVSSGKHWADMMTLGFDRLQHRADAIVQCDAHRASLVVQARRNEIEDQTVSDELTALDAAIWAVGRQNQQTLAFLRDLTEYNMSIARYALATLPPSVSAEQLSGRLAIAKSTRRDL